jgi:hypothetical protein
MFLIKNMTVILFFRLGIIWQDLDTLTCTLKSVAAALDCTNKTHFTLPAVTQGKISKHTSITQKRV